MNPFTRQQKWRQIYTILMAMVLYCLIPQNAKGQQILKDVIIGDDVACPGLTNEYHIGLDLYFPMNIQWRIIDGPGEIKGSDRGKSVKVEWKTSDRGHTKLVMFAVSYYPPLGLIDTISIHVDKDLNRMNLNCISEIVMDFGMDCERYIDVNELLTNGKIMCTDDFEFTLELENISIPNPVPKIYNGRTFIATITHKETGQFCRSNITLGDFSGPRLICKNDTVLCSDPRAYDPKNNLFGKPEVIADCNERYTLKVNEYKYVDVEDDPYIEGYIERVWRATDQNGNKTDCRDTVFLRKVIFDEIVCPADTEITCDSIELLDQPLRTGSPTFDGMPIYSEDPYCKVYVNYEDEEISGCGGSKTIFRTWTITSYEEESLREMSCVQTIEVLDTTGPKMVFDESAFRMEAHQDVEGLAQGIPYPTFYKNSILEDCKAEGDFPVPQFIEDCSTQDELMITIKWGKERMAFDMADQNPDIRFRNMTIGKYLVEYSAYDECGNFGRDTIVLVFNDKKPPVLVLNDDLGVALTDNKSLTWGNVSSFDRGTYDNCALKIVLARRVDWETACGYTSDQSIPSEVRDYYDQQAQWVYLQDDSCMSDIVDYGWSDKIPFCCEDVCEEGVLVEFLAIDEFCNYSKLVTRVKVTDESRPVVQQKLPNISMNCHTYQSLYQSEVEQGNTGIFGTYVTSAEARKIRQINVLECSDGRITPYVERTIDIMDGLVMDNCSVEIEEEVNKNIGACGEGWIERIFTIKNPCDVTSRSRNTIQVIQKILITKDCRLRAEDFKLPYADTTVYNCGLTEVPARGPELIRKENCKDLGVAYTDLVLEEVVSKAGVCYTIQRTWEVSDWCETDPYYLPEFVQYIYIINTEGPEIRNAKMEDICIDRGCDFVLNKTFDISDDCTPVKDLVITWRIEKKNSSGWETFQSGKGSRISGVRLNTGEFRMTVEAEDDCHNKTRISSTFRVGYCKALSITGPESITFNLNSTNDQLRLSDIPHEVNHPCPDARYEVRIRYKGEGLVGNDGKMLPPLPGATSLQVTCDKIGTNLIELWIVDDAGNASQYTLTMAVKDPRGLCPGADNRLVGHVQMPNGNPLTDVSVRLNGPVTEIRRKMTSADGRFDLGAFPPTENLLRVRPDKSDHPSDGITAFDALQIFQMATGKLSPATPYERLAADINEDGVISVFDVMIIQQFLLNKTNQLPGRQWIFINSEMQPESKIQAHQEYRSRLHFVGVKKGDVNYSAGIRSSGRTVGERQWVMMGTPTSSPGIVRIPVYMDNINHIESVQLSLVNRNSSPWIAIEPGRMYVESEDYRMTENELDLVWIKKRSNESEKSESGEPDFYLVFDPAGQEEIAPEKIELSLRLQPEIYGDQKLRQHVRLEHQRRQSDLYQVSAPYPNPFAHETHFDISGAPGILKQVEVYDVSGRQIFSQKLNQQVTEYALKGQELGAAGFYTIRFVFDSEVVNKKLYYLP